MDSKNTGWRVDKSWNEKPRYTFIIDKTVGTEISCELELAVRKVLWMKVEQLPNQEINRQNKSFVKFSLVHDFKYKSKNFKLNAN